jgi:hypothetical protein
MLRHRFDDETALEFRWIDRTPTGVDEVDEVFLEPQRLFVVMPALRGEPFGDDGVDLGEERIRGEHLGLRGVGQQ